MAEKETPKKSSGFWEKVQNMGIFIAMLLGLQKTPHPGSSEAKSSRIPDWIIQLLPESFTLEDESWRKLIQSSCPDLRATKVEIEFRSRLSKYQNGYGYDAGEYRRRLMHAKKEFLEQARKPAVKDEEGARVSFEHIIFRDPCNEFLNQLIAEVEVGGSPENIFERQRQFAVLQNFLVPMGGMKKFFRWIKNNKIETLVGIFMIPWGILQLIIWLLS